jgi:hypothetical protein
VLALWPEPGVPFAVEAILLTRGIVVPVAEVVRSGSGFKLSLVAGLVLRRHSLQRAVLRAVFVILFVDEVIWEEAATDGFCAGKDHLVDVKP